MNSQNTSKGAGLSRPLTEGEEKLLVRYFDGEHSFLDGLKVKRLLQNREAEEFLETLVTIGEIARNEHTGILSTDPRPVDLWDRISARIESEEHAAIFLGSRAGKSSDDEGMFGKIGRFVGVSWNNVAWGTSGAVAAAALTVILAGNTPPSQVAQLTNVSESGVVNTSAPAPERMRNVRTVSAVNRKHEGNSVLSRLSQSEFGRFEASEGRNTQVASLPIQVKDEDSEPTAVEVNWMRSSGRVRLMQNPSEGGAIIWVKRRPQVQIAQQDFESVGEPLIVYDDRAPQSIPVRSFGR